MDLSLVAKKVGGTLVPPLFFQGLKSLPLALQNRYG